MIDLTNLATPENTESGTTRVFVYGTLKAGHGNNHLLANSQFAGRGALNINGKFVDLGPFPGLVYTDELEPTTVLGEVYCVDDDTLAALDFLEGHPRFYCRRKVKTLQGVRVWVYCLPEEYLSHAEVPHGLWRPSDHEIASWDMEEHFEDDEESASG